MASQSAATLHDRVASRNHPFDEKGGEAPKNAHLTKIKHLTEILRRGGWHRNTSYWPDRWLDDCPSIGQCAVTSLLIQDKFGGEIIEAVTDQGELHFFNQIPGLGDVDLTHEQFSIEVKFETLGVVRRAILLSNPDTRHRYRLLVRNVKNLTIRGTRGK